MSLVRWVKNWSAHYRQQWVSKHLKESGKIYVLAAVSEKWAQAVPARTWTNGKIFLYCNLMKRPHWCDALNQTKWHLCDAWDIHLNLLFMPHFCAPPDHFQILYMLVSAECSFQSHPFHIRLGSSKLEPKVGCVLLLPFPIFRKERDERKVGQTDRDGVCWEERHQMNSWETLLWLPLQFTISDEDGNLYRRMFKSISIFLGDNPHVSERRIPCWFVASHDCRTRLCFSLLVAEEVNCIFRSRCYQQIPSLIVWVTRCYRQDFRSERLGKRKNKRLYTNSYCPCDHSISC